MTYISPGKVFAHLDRLSAWQHGQRPAPVTIEWDLSNRCVLGCQDCHFAHTHVKGPWASRPRALPMAYDSTGDLADAAMVRRALSEMRAAGVAGVIWSGGGEPTTHPDWTVTVAHAARLGLQQGMYTLGGLLTRESARLLAGHAAWVVVSLDAATGAAYASEKGVAADRYDRACDGIAWLSEARGAVVGASFLLHRGNWTEAAKMYRQAMDLGATYATFRPAIQTSPAKPAECANDRAWIDDAGPTLRWLASQPDVECDPDRFARYRNWVGRDYATCHGIKLTATVTPDGRVWVCPQRRGVPGSCVGDLRTESFADLWARHPGQWTDFADCRVMCRLHLINQQLAPVFQPRAHEAFV